MVLFILIIRKPSFRTSLGNPSNFGVGFGFLQKSLYKNGLVHGLWIFGILADSGFSNIIKCLFSNEKCKLNLIFFLFSQ